MGIVRVFAFEGIFDELEAINGVFVKNLEQKNWGLWCLIFFSLSLTANLKLFMRVLKKRKGSKEIGLMFFYIKMGKRAGRQKGYDIFFPQVIRRHFPH